MTEEQFQALYDLVALYGHDIYMMLFTAGCLLFGALGAIFGRIGRPH